MSGAWTAQFEDVCADCDGRINIGQLIYRIDDAYEHVQCPERVDRGGPVVCDTCWLTLPCGCEDES